MNCLVKPCSSLQATQGAIFNKYQIFLNAVNYFRYVDVPDLNYHFRSKIERNSMHATVEYNVHSYTFSSSLHHDYNARAICYNECYGASVSNLHPVMLDLPISPVSSTRHALPSVHCI